MPRNLSDLKSGGGGGAIPMLSPHPEKWGDASPPVPHRSTPVCTLCKLLLIIVTVDKIKIRARALW